MARKKKLNPFFSKAEEFLIRTAIFLIFVLGLLSFLLHEIKDFIRLF